MRAIYSPYILTSKEISHKNLRHFAQNENIFNNKIFVNCNSSRSTIVTGFVYYFTCLVYTLRKSIVTLQGNEGCR